MILDRYGDGLEATITRGGNIHLQISVHSDVSHGMIQQLRSTFAVQIRVLGDISNELDLASRYVYVKADWILFQLGKTDEHGNFPNGERGRGSFETAYS
ncbi:MAG: hypothetical protein ACJ74Y_17765 [Bryobacteraceae bacterium]